MIDVSQASLKDKPTNVEGLLFAEQEAGYLAGYLAGDYAKENNIDTISSVGGQKIPPVDHYIAGYQAGAKAANPDIKTLNAYSQDFVDQAKCKEIALDQIERGSGVVFQVAGQCGLGALDAAKQEGKQGIGVDADQAYLGDHVLTSATKKVDVAVLDTVKAAQADKFQAGTDQLFELKNDGVGIGKISAAGALAGEQARPDQAADHRRRDRRARHREVGVVVTAESRPQDAAELALELRGITKRFGTLTANDAIDLTLRRGEVHALLGENGAGKSTLMNVVYGMVHPDEGEIRVDGERVTIGSPRDAMRHGIGMVFQHFMLIQVMTVAENMVLGDEPRSGGLLDVKEPPRRTLELSERYGLNVDPDARVEDISVGMQQRVEILRALDRGARVLVLDEPTAVLTAQETAELMRVLAELKAGGTSIVFISHKLPEVLKVADRVTVLRRGKSVGTIDTAGADEPMLARMMVGRDVVLRVEKDECKPGEVALEVSDLHVLDDRGLPAVDGVTLQVARRARSSRSPGSTATARASSSRP